MRTAVFAAGLLAVGLQGAAAFSPAAIAQLAGRSTALRPAACRVPTLRTAAVSLRMAEDDSVEVTKEEETALKKTSIKKRPKGSKDKKPISEFSAGSTVSGKVVSIMPYGAFVDIGATTDGLVHVSQLADDFVKDIESVVKVGDEVQVRITEINADTNKVSLSMRSENAPQQQRQQRGGGGKKEIPQEFKDMDDKTFIKGTVSSVTDYGAFVTISEGVDGLVHISQLAEERVESTAKYVKVGQEVDVRIIDVDSKKGKLSLSMKAWSEPPPRDETEDIKSFVDESPTGKTAFEIAWEKAQSKVAA
jgi:ribosomal protein S1